MSQLTSGRFDLDLAAARLLTVGFLGTQLTSALRGLLDRGVAGVILFSRNIESAAQVAALVQEIKTYAGRPLMVTIDHEGGLVQRLRAGFTRIPAMRALGQKGNEALAEQLGFLMGRELRAVGIDMNYAPVLDIDTNPSNPVIGNRSMGSDPHLVARLGLALGRGLERSGVAACGKHFPGHGDTEIDSHQDLPILRHDMRRLYAVELIPFRAWAQAGFSALMTAHVIFQELDPRYPATMSRPLLQGLLRAELGFQGLVISDDLEMRAIADHYGVEDAIIHGLDAGVDQFLCCHSADVAHRLIDTVVEAVGSRRIERERLADANLRAGSFLRRWACPAAPPRLDCLQSEDFAQLLRQLEVNDDATFNTDPTERNHSARG